MVHVKNVTQNAMLIDQGQVANNVWTRFKGLMGVKELPAGDGLMITPCNSIHCMFMSIPIDVLYVNRENGVIAVDQAMKPWRIDRIHLQSRYVLELPAGTVARTGTRIGDQLDVTY